MSTTIHLATHLRTRMRVQVKEEKKMMRCDSVRPSQNKRLRSANDPTVCGWVDPCYVGCRVLLPILFRDWQPHFALPSFFGFQCIFGEKT
jgi:hypothetical protein